LRKQDNSIMCSVIICAICTEKRYCRILHIIHQIFFFFFFFSFLLRQNLDLCFTGLCLLEIRSLDVQLSRHLFGSLDSCGFPSLTIFTSLSSLLIRASSSSSLVLLRYLTISYILHYYLMLLFFICV